MKLYPLLLLVGTLTGCSKSVPSAPANEAGAVAWVPCDIAGDAPSGLSVNGVEECKSAMGGQPLFVADTSVKVTDDPGDTPEFRRTYKVRINKVITMTVVMRSWDYDNERRDDSELRQADDKWVEFDLRAPADKILDRDILSTVQKYCDQIIRMDEAYMNSVPSEFVDKKGQRWKRVPKGAKP